MVNAKSLANLEKGRKSKHSRKISKGGKTWAQLINEFRAKDCPIAPGQTWEQAFIEQGFKQAMLGNSGIYREIMQRSEPQDIGIKQSGKLVIEIIEDGTTSFAETTHGAEANH